MLSWPLVPMLDGARAPMVRLTLAIAATVNVPS